MSNDFVKKEFSPEDIAWYSKEEALLEEMGLTRADTDKLRKTMLSAEEAVHAKQEEMTAIRQHKGRKPEWQEFLDSKARMGRVLYAGDFFRVLKSLLPQLRCADGLVRGQIAMFTPVLKTYEDGFHPGWHYLGWAHSDWNPEYTLDYCDEDGVPKGKRNGWRTILLNAIIAKDGTGQFVLKANGVVKDGTGKPLKILDEDRVLKVFGHPTAQAASLYRRQLWEFRNNKKLPAEKWF